MIGNYVFVDCEEEEQERLRKNLADFNAFHIKHAGSKRDEKKIFTRIGRAGPRDSAQQFTATVPKLGVKSGVPSLELSKSVVKSAVPSLGLPGPAFKSVVASFELPEPAVKSAVPSFALPGPAIKSAVPSFAIPRSAVNSAVPSFGIPGSAIKSAVPSFGLPGPADKLAVPSIPIPGSAVNSAVPSFGLPRLAIGLAKFNSQTTNAIKQLTDNAARQQSTAVDGSIVEATRQTRSAARKNPQLAGAFKKFDKKLFSRLGRSPEKAK